MDLHRPRFPQGFLIKFFFVLSLSACLLLAGCFGSSDDTPPVGEAVSGAEVAEAAADTPDTPAEPAEQVAEENAEEESEQAEQESSPAPAATEASESAQAPAEPRSFIIDPELSEARFIVNEVLFGNPNEVVGRTSEVSGTITIDLGDPTQTTVSPIQINARSLMTDNRFRNRSVNRMILQSNRDEYQFITFTPSEIEGLPSEATAGDSLALQITGDLQIRDIVQTITFAVNVTADSETQLTGLAQTTVQRADFELTIPEVDGVADVTEEVQLELEFVATAGE